VKVMGASSKLKAHLSEWIQRRLYMLHQLVTVPTSKKEGKEEEELYRKIEIIPLSRLFSNP
jgi:hypothetical protein